jgi:hypothetical protein
MITFLASPKAFEGKTRIAQTRAILSWLHVHPDAEVILFGEALGADELCKKLGIVYCPNVETSESGVPLFNSIVDFAKNRAKHDLQVFLNCDIILTPSFLSPIGLISWSKFLLIGQRITIDRDVSVDESSEDLISTLNQLAFDRKIKLDPPAAIDYFVFPRGMWSSLPPVIIGRAYYDGALLAHCLRSSIPIIDITFVSPVLHPEHDYQHVKGGRREVFSGHDAKLNQERNGINHSPPTVSDAQWRIESGTLRGNVDRHHWLRSSEIRLRFILNQTTLGLGARIVWRIFYALGLLKNTDPTLSDVLDQMSKGRILETH